MKQEGKNLGTMASRKKQETSQNMFMFWKNLHMHLSAHAMLNLAPKFIFPSGGRWTCNCMHLQLRTGSIIWP